MNPHDDRYKDAVRELQRSLHEKEPHLRRAMDILGEHFSSATIIVHMYDPTAHLSARRSICVGDPYAIRALLAQQLQEMMNAEAQINRQPPSSDEDTPSFS